MKKLALRKNDRALLITSTSILTGTMLVTTLSSCSKIEKQTNISMDPTVTNGYESVEPSYSSDVSNTIETSETESYDFIWEYDETEAFEKIVHKKYNMSIAQYICSYGFTDDLNRSYTDFINGRFAKNYKSVPFKKANYFFDYINRDYDVRHYFDDFEHFKKGCLRNDKARLSGFNNKVVLSYLIQNDIPLGELVPIENFKSIMGDDLYKYDPTLKTIGQNPKTGNYERSYVYNKNELVELLQAYNGVIYKLCTDNSIKTSNLFEKPEVVELYNKHLGQFYKIDIKLGQKLTKEQYIAMYGEEPLDLSYIQGAVMQVPQETMARPVSYIDYNNYNVYYNPNYNMYSEEDTGRTR